MQKTEKLQGKWSSSCCYRDTCVMPHCVGVCLLSTDICIWSLLLDYGSQQPKICWSVSNPVSI